VKFPFLHRVFRSGILFSVHLAGLNCIQHTHPMGSHHIKHVRLLVFVYLALISATMNCTMTVHRRLAVRLKSSQLTITPIQSIPTLYHTTSYSTYKLYLTRIQNRLHNNIAPYTVPHRTLASITTTPTTKEQFNTATEQFFNILQDRLEQSDIELNTDVESQYNDGVLTLRHKHNTWVLNQHSVTRQIWLSSPVSGPSKYNWYNEKKLWLNERDGVRKLSDLLSDEWSDALQCKVDFTDEF
jgi:iron donor protein CyaY